MRLIVRNGLRHLLFALVLLAGIAGATPPPKEDQIILALIQRVEARTDLVFVRNGSDHNAAEAATHLRSKYKYFKVELIDAEDFIERCGSRSELTRKAYKVRTADGTVRDAGDFLREELRALRAH
ncbi:DUF5329 family protein [Variovorax sp. dw_954]|uniref:DUF5329 family protein n=1 Tax=Variovorax sp. dw_954 TaxID=2720078 RepID=UPI001BD3FFFD|nr:DUF5329 family protein [Variovorax sp. dw_954]